MKILMMSKRICLTKGENVNHAYLEDVEKKSLDCHYQKGGDRRWGGEGGGEEGGKR